MLQKPATNSQYVSPFNPFFKSQKRLLEAWEKYFQKLKIETYRRRLEGSQIELMVKKSEG